ncbi:DUF2793 domain-containing protein [Methylobacterium sp. Gmos1]
MPDATTANLALPLLQAAQAQKHVTHNEALVALDTLVQLAVLDKDLTAPPASPAEGDRYLIAGASPTGAWTGWAGRVVRYQDGAWRSFVPRSGWLAFVADEADLYTYTGAAWASFRSTLTAFQNLTRLGIGTSADATNPFAAKLNKALWTALATAEGGTGDLRYTLNKQAAGNVLSLLFQSGFSGRAELGLTGDDDLRLKVSADGGTWREALRVDRATGGLDLAAAEASVPVAATVDLGALGCLRVALTGTGTVTGFGTGPNRVRFLRFTGAATLTHNAASLVLPGGANLVTAAGDTALAVSDASGNWRVLDVARASGKPVTGPGSADITDASASGRSVLTGTAASGATALGLGTGSSVTFAGLSVTTLSTGQRPVFAGNTPWDSGNLNPGDYLNRLGGGTVAGWVTFTGGGRAVIEGTTGGLGTSSGGLARLEVKGGQAVSDAAYMTFHRPGIFASYFGLDADSQWKVGGWSAGSNAYKIFHEGVSASLAPTWGGGTFNGTVLIGANCYPTADNAYSCGLGSNRWSVVYAASGTINTSDAREKTGLAVLTAAELAWAKDLAAGLGTFQFLASIAEKGAEAARHHVGLTVQGAIAMGRAHGLDPFRYAFICHDAWDATPAVDAVTETVLDPDGAPTGEVRTVTPAQAGREAGDRYSFRTDQLALFVTAGQEQRLAALEARLPPLAAPGA